MDKELAKVFTTAIVKYIDSERSEGTMCCSNVECERLEKALEEDEYKYVEAFINKKLSRLTEFEKKVADIIDLWHEDYVQWSTPGASAHNYPDQIKPDAAELLALAREQFIKDGYIIEKKAFHDAVEKVDPKVMKEVSDNVDKTKEGLTELEQCLFDYGNERDMYEYDPTNVAKLNEKVIELTKFYANVLLTIAKREILKDLPRWRKWENGACGNSDNIPIAIVKRGINYELASTLGIQGERYIMLSDLEKLPGFNEDEK